MGTFYTVFSLGAFPINKYTYLSLLMGGFRGNPQPRPGSKPFVGFRWVVRSIHGLKPVGVVYINKTSGLPVYSIGLCDYT